MHYGPKHKQCGTPTIAIADIPNEAKQLHLAQSDSDLLWTWVDQQPRGLSYPTNTHTHTQRGGDLSPLTFCHAPGVLPAPHTLPIDLEDGVTAHHSQRQTVLRDTNHTDMFRERETGWKSQVTDIDSLGVCVCEWMCVCVRVCEWVCVWECVCVSVWVCECVCVCVCLWPISLVGLIREPIFQ